MGGEGGDPAEGVDRLHLEVLSDGVDVALVISSKARRDSRTLRVKRLVRLTSGGSRSFLTWSVYTNLASEGDEVKE